MICLCFLMFRLLWTRLRYNLSINIDLLLKIVKVTIIIMCLRSTSLILMDGGISSFLLNLYQAGFWFYFLTCLHFLGKITSLISWSSLSILPLTVCTCTLWVYQSISSLDERHQPSSIAATQIVQIIYAPPFLQNILFSVLFNWLNWIHLL